MSYPVALWTPGPAGKVNGGVNTVKGVVCHSMVGSWMSAYGELIKPTRRASWHFSVLQNGVVHQHYETTAQTWHAGSAYNNSTVGVEHEGGFSPHNEPLTPQQLAASVNLVRWLSVTHNFPMVRKVGLFEHNEVSGEPTACPSNRIPWAYYTEEDEMAVQLVWCPDNQRLYAIGGTPTPAWITDPVAAADLQKALGAPKIALTWKALVALGAK